jgi:hypothetical protein
MGIVLAINTVERTKNVEVIIITTVTTLHLILDLDSAAITRMEMTCWLIEGCVVGQETVIRTHCDDVETLVIGGCVGGERK